MKAKQRRIIGFALATVLILTAFLTTGIGSFAASDGIIASAGWFESAYAEWAEVSGADGYNAYIAPAGTSNWTRLDSELVRKTESGYRADAVGLKAGDYVIKIVPTAGGTEQADKALTTDPLKVEAYDRSGYAHFNYTEGVGAYNDDGTLKDNAIVLYVTNENKNTVSVTSKDGTTVTGIGNILGTTGMDVGGGLNAKGGKANGNSDILRKLAADGTPLVVRIVGSVKGASSSTLASATSEIDGLTQYDGVDYGGSVGDNGFMARMSGGKNITIEGIGYDATLDGWGLHFICQTADYAVGYGRSFEVRNLSFKNVPEDCVGMEGQQEDSTLTAPVERCWVHHCTFYAPVITNPAESDKDGGDGACDFKRGQYFTNSYCHYNGYHKTNLVGSSDDSLQYHLTYHHNYWKNCESRGPLARNANIHMYNNIFDSQTSYCMNPRANAYIFSEYNMFYMSKNPVQVKSGAVKSYNDSFASCTGDNNATIVTDRSQKVSSGNKYEHFDTDPTLSYIPAGNYTIQESIPEMKAVVLAYAGVQKHTVITPDDVNLSVIPADRYPTEAVSLDYVKELNNSYITAVSGSYDNMIFNVKKVASDCITVGGSPNSCDIVFYVDTAVNITMTEVPSTYSPVLCNEYGEEIITGTGSAYNLPSGFYFIQAGTYDIGGAKFKEAKLSKLEIYAVDPNAAPNPITPPPTTDPDQGGDSGNTGGDNTGSGDNTGGGNQGGGNITVPVGSYTHSVTENGTTDPNGFFSLSGSTSTSKGDVIFNGLTLTKCMKVSSSASISLIAPADGKVTLVFNPSCAGYTLHINGGDEIAIPSDGLFVFDVSANTSYTVTKGKSESFLYYLVYTPNSTDTPVDPNPEDPKPEDPIDPNPGTPEGPTTGKHSFLAGDVELGADKDTIAEGTTYADGFFKIEGKVIKRVDSGAEFVKSVELAKDLGGAISFIIGADAKVTIVVSSTGGSNTSAFAIIDASGKAIANNEGLDTVYGSMDSRITLTYDLSAGSYKLVCPDHAEYDRGLRVYEITVDLGNEDAPVDPAPHEHLFVDGKCECGELDPDYNAPVDPKPEDPKPEDPTEPEPEKPKTFWDAIVAFFKSIGDFFAKLFGIKKD